MLFCPVFFVKEAWKKQNLSLQIQVTRVSLKKKKKKKKKKNQNFKTIVHATDLTIIEFL